MYNYTITLHITRLYFTCCMQSYALYAITYICAVGSNNYTLRTRLDAAMTRSTNVKGACALGLMNAVSNARVHQDIDKGGIHRHDPIYWHPPSAPTVCA